jgi:hypothetical protein
LNIALVRPFKLKGFELLGLTLICIEAIAEVNNGHLQSSRQIIAGLE